MNKMYRQGTFWIVPISTIFLFLFIFSTDPKRLNVPLLLVPPACIFLILYMLLKSLLGAYTEFTVQKRRIVSATVASGPVLLLLLATLGQLTARDAVLSLLFVSGLGFYASRGLDMNTS